MAITPLIPEIQALSPTIKLENQLQRPFSGFTLGQIVQALVSSKEAATNLLTLQIGEQSIPVETTINSPPGQRLTLEVTALTPQLQLKVVDPNQINGLNQRIGSSLHSLLHQGEALSELATLTQATQLPQLLPSSQNILHQLQTSLQSIESPPPALATIITQLAALLAATETTPAASQNQSIGALLLQLQALPETPAATRQEAAVLAKIFLPTETNIEAPLPHTNTESLRLLAASSNPELTPNDAMLQLQKVPEALQGVLRPLIALYISTNDSPQPLAQLTHFLLHAAQATTTSVPPPPVDGRQLQQAIEQLGTQMERLLSQGKHEEAATTLKFALLELTTNQAPAPALQQAAEDALHTIQFSQLVQLRLGFESIFFMPLPFPFLQSGFLLVDSEHQKKSQDSQQKKRPHELSLYLQLEGLGNLTITVHQQEKNITLTFYSQDSPRAQFIGQHKQELANMLTTGTLYSAQFLVGAKEPVKILIEKILHAPTGMVNISV